jgi:hypothetical protein
MLFVAPLVFLFTVLVDLGLVELGMMFMNQIPVAV